MYDFSFKSEVKHDLLVLTGTEHATMAPLLRAFFILLNNCFLVIFISFILIYSGTPEVRARKESAQRPPVTAS